jgi:hypothetical protein
MTNDVYASMLAGAEGLDKLRDDLPKTLASMRAARCSEDLVVQYPPLLGRLVALFEDLKGVMVKDDLDATRAVSAQMQVEQAKLLQLVQSIWKSAKRKPQSQLN